MRDSVITMLRIFRELVLGLPRSEITVLNKRKKTPQTVAEILLLAASSVTALFIAEFLLDKRRPTKHADPVPLSIQRQTAADKAGVSFDARTKYEYIQDLRAEGLTVVTHFPGTCCRCRHCALRIPQEQTKLNIQVVSLGRGLGHIDRDRKRNGLLQVI